MTKPYTGQIALVTDASRSVGAAMARDLAPRRITVNHPGSTATTPVDGPSAAAQRAGIPLAM